MDKAWVNLPRPTADYREGVRNFVAVSLERLGNPSKIRCPCTRCRNMDYQTSDDVVSHLVMFGMDKTYNVWIFHGEERSSTSSKMTCDLDDISDTYRMFFDARVNESKENPEMPIKREDVWCKAHTKKNGEVPTTFIVDCVSKIQDIKSSQTSPSTSQLINEDVLSQTLGSERNGRVRGLGFGITPSKLGVHMSSAKKFQALEGAYSELRNEMEMMKKLVQGLTSNGNANTNMSSPHLHRVGSRDNVNGKTPSPSSHNGSSNVRDCYNLNSKGAPLIVDVEHKCKLLNWQKTVVAEAKIASTDPNALVHNVPLGKDAWKVWVLVALDPRAHLWRPNSFMSFIEDAVGSTVAWHKDFVSFD